MATTRSTGRGSDPLLFSLEGASFYIPFDADPVVSKTAFAGRRRLADPGRRRRPDFLENHCSVLGGPRSDRLNTGASSGCGDWEKLGTPLLIGTFYGPAADKGTGYTVAVERAKTNTGTSGLRRAAAASSSPRTRTRTTRRRSGEEPDPLLTGSMKSADRRRVHADRHSGAARAVRQRHLRRPAGLEWQHRVRLVLRLQRLHADDAGTRVQGGLQPGDGHGDVDEPRLRLGDLPILDIEVDPTTGTSTPPTTTASSGSVPGRRRGPARRTAAEGPRIRARADRRQKAGDGLSTRRHTARRVQDRAARQKGSTSTSSDETGPLPRIARKQRAAYGRPLAAIRLNPLARERRRDSEKLELALAALVAHGDDGHAVAAVVVEAADGPGSRPGVRLTRASSPWPSVDLRRSRSRRA